MKRKKMEQKIENIFLSECGMKITDEIKDKHLLGEDVFLKARDLVLVMNKIEKTFKFQILEEDIIDESFSTFNGIVKVSCRYLNIKE